MESDRQFHRILTFSRGITRIPHLRELLQAREIVYAGCYPGKGKADCVVGWGRKPNTHRARHYAKKNRLPYLSLEDGFLRSVGLAVKGYPPLSLVIDDLGMYYDAHTPSRLEAWLNARPSPSDALGQTDILHRAERCMQRLTRAGLSKYNDTPPAYCPLERQQRPRVLVVDQTVGDLSVSHGMGTPQAFATMVQAALDEHPQAEVLVKTHPDVLAGTKQGYLARLQDTDRLRVMAQNINPIALLATVDHVYVVTSLLGFEALMLGKRVTCFGAPFYAGWGLTDDRLSLPRRHQRRTLTQLFAAAYILYPRYLDPDTGKRAAIEQVVTHLETQRHHFTANRGRIYCFGFSLWKRNYIRAYLKAPGNQIRFVRSLRQARRLGLDSRVRIAVWGAKARADLEALARAYDVPIWRVEDGFLRSVGLGSDLTAPASLVVDTRGIYFDPAGPSDLEHLLQEKPFTEAELDRARQLRAAILALGLSKYNVGAQGRLTVAADPGQRRLLVPGQVPDDASIRLGCGKICSDVALLQTVRAEHPRAFLLYKPHPDLLSGNRRGRIDRALLAPICDQVVLDHSIADCLAMADEVHTMTSLVGFEALLRGLRVITYGMPFYAGWGLTEDRIPIPRRSRRLTLDELVAGVLIGYPRYLNRRTGAFTSAEAVVAELAAERRRQRSQHLLSRPWPVRQLRKLAHLWKGLAYAR